jgi:hypothetical protein
MEPKTQRNSYANFRANLHTGLLKLLIVLALAFAIATIIGSIAARAEITDEDRDHARVIMYSEQCGYVEPGVLEFSKKKGRPYEMRGVYLEYERWMNDLRARNMNEGKVKRALCNALEPLVTLLNAFELCMKLVDREKLINDLDKVMDECWIVARTKVR